MIEEEKKSFLLFTDRWKEIQMLSDEQCGILFKAIFTYVNTGEPLETDDLALRLFFSFLTAQIDENTRKWEATRQARAEAGKRGMASRWGNSKGKQKVTNHNKAIPPITKITDTDTDTVTDTDTDTVTDTVTGTVTVSVTMPQDSTALERAALPVPEEEEVISWDEIDFELM